MGCPPQERPIGRAVKVRERVCNTLESEERGTWKKMHLIDNYARFFTRLE